MVEPRILPKDLSLTRHLEQRQSPVCRYFNESFPKTSGFPKAVRARLSGRAMIEPPAGMSSGVLGLVGMAIDYRIRYYFAAEPAAERSAAAKGLQLAEVYGLRSGLSPEQLAGYFDFLESHDRYAADLKPQGRQLEESDEEELNRRCVVLALFEQLYRIGNFADTWLHRAPLDPLSIPEQHWIDDLCRMSEAAYVAMHERLGEPHHLNPVFEGSRDLRETDADLIVGLTLIDIKATKNPAGKSMETLYQLLEYALLDYPDQVNLEQLGLYFARYGALVEWPMDAFLADIGARGTLAEHRKEFQGLLKGA